MKVLHLLQSDKFSGAENVVCQIISMFKNEPDIEMVYCSTDGPIRDALKERSVNFVPLKKFYAKEIKNVIKREKPDIVHAHDMRASFVAACVCGKVPLISHVHNNNFDSRGLSVKSIAYMLAAIKAKHIFWVSQSSFGGYAFHKLFGKKSTVLYNIIDIDALYRKMKMDSNAYDYDVIYVGRLTYQKNPQRLMKVFEKVVKTLPNVKIAVVGTGDLEGEAKVLCDELNLQNNVEFLGFQSNPLKMIHDSKIMIMTSRWEGTPMCALEAMALGVPIVSTPTDGLNDLISEGENGFLSDNDDVLAEKTALLVSDAEKQRMFSNGAQEFSKQYNNMKIYKNEIVKAYQK